MLTKRMKIQDRIKDITGVEDAYWDSHRNRLVVYYSDSLDKIKVLVANAVMRAGLQRAIDEITFIS